MSKLHNDDFDKIGIPLSFQIHSHHGRQFLINFSLFDFQSIEYFNSTGSILLTRNTLEWTHMHRMLLWRMAGWTQTHSNRYLDYHGMFLASIHLEHSYLDGQEKDEQRWTSAKRGNKLRKPFELFYYALLDVYCCFFVHCNDNSSSATIEWVSLQLDCFQSVLIFTIFDFGCSYLFFAL